ncbi:glucan biosynthesis protein [Coraliomargarita sp. W4R53]
MKFHLSLLLLSTFGTVQAQQERVHITLDLVAQEAQALIQQPPSQAEPLPDNLKALTYDQYREIRFRPSEALWWNADSRFRAEFFHPGHIFENQISIFEASETHVQQIPFMKDAYDYGTSGYDPGFFKKPKGYSGIRVKYPLNNEEVYDELIVFQGASYFRALGAGHNFGLSLRGLAMNTLGDQEDFPRFTKIWLKKPQAGSKELTLFALLEGKKVTGAYRFDVHPMGVTKIDVQARLFFREGGAAEVGIAPLTSMFVHGENTNHLNVHDWRPEVHDSDGLLVHANNEWDWVPLENLPGRSIRRIPTAKLRGFGLLQRDRDFKNYKDLEAHYERRPSAWVEPKDRWSTGEIVLYSFGTNTEATDNVTAYWKPDLKENLSDGVDFAYTITLQTKDPVHSLAKVLETRVGQRTLDQNATTLIIEFSRPESLARDEIESLSVGFDYGSAEPIEKPIIQYNEPEDRIRVFANFRTPADASAETLYEMSAQLLREGHQVSERWNYTWKR